MDQTTKRAPTTASAENAAWSLVLTSTNPERPRVVRVRLGADGGAAAGEGLVLGRAEGCGIRVIDASVSRRHFRIARTAHGDGFSVEDLGSANGTRVDGKTLTTTTSASLRLGSVIEIDGYVGLVQTAAEGDPSSVTVGATATKRASPNDGVVIESPAMKDAYALLDALGESDITVLILGETGTGKDVFAEAVHRASTKRAKQPYVRLNCAALPEQLLESELFGHEKGAFTGAVQSKPGLIESADGGTIFLDEIGEMPLGVQAKLLRVLESGEVQRLGTLRPKHVDVRFIAATNRDIEEASRNGEFRSDLFYRLDGVSLTLPPLRDRKEEILPLAKLFLSSKTSAPTLTEEAQSKLLSHTWPGNVRELRNVMERAHLLSRNAASIDAAHIVFSAKLQPSAASASSAAAAGVKDELASVERKRILETLEQCDGNKTKAAKLLGISRTTLLARLEAYGITTK